MISLRLLLPLLLVVPTLAEAADGLQATTGDVAVAAVDEASSDDPAPKKKKTKKKRKSDTASAQETVAPAAEADPSARPDDNRPAKKKKKKKTADAGNAADAATEGKTAKTTDDDDGAIILAVDAEAQLSLLNEAVVLDVGWRLRVVDDLYDGYYSRVENRFSMGVETTTGPPELSLETKTRFDINEVIYGDQAYAAGGRHPPLDYGDRRELRRSTLSVSARFPAKAAVHVFAEVAATAQVTNFPDYATGVFPKTQAYEVDWDYQTARALIGLEMVLDVEDTPLR